MLADNCSPSTATCNAQCFSGAGGTNERRTECMPCEAIKISYIYKKCCGFVLGVSLLFFLGVIEGRALPAVLRESKDIGNRCGRLFHSTASTSPPRPSVCRK